MSPFICVILILSLSKATEYIVVEESKNYANAKSHCQTVYGTNLAVFSSWEEAATIQALIAIAIPSGTGNQRAWVGLNDLDTPNLWVFEDDYATENYCGGDCDNTGGIALFWADNEPNNNLGQESCAVARNNNLTPDQLLADVACSNSCYFVCQCMYYISYIHSQVHKSHKSLIIHILFTTQKQYNKHTRRP